MPLKNKSPVIILKKPRDAILFLTLKILKKPRDDCAFGANRTGNFVKSLTLIAHIGLCCAVGANETEFCKQQGLTYKYETEFCKVNDLTDKNETEYEKDDWWSEMTRSQE
jgi:hypothetical protein